MTSKGKKSTNAGKKGKTRTPEKKILTDAPVTAGVDKEKMAAFFSKADEQAVAADEVPKAESPAVETPVAKEETPPAASTPPQEPAPPAGKKSPASSDNGSFSLVFLFIILGVIGISWFYYINSHTARIKATSATLKTAAVPVVASGLEQKIKDLEAQIACLQSRLAALEAQARKASSVLVLAPPKVKKVEIKGATAVKDSSFKKAPVPFWRQEGFRHPSGPGKSLIKPRPAAKKVTEPVAKPAPAVKSVKEVKKSAAPAPVVKDSSFDKAPVPFWRQEEFKSPASRAQAVLQSNADKAAAKDKKPAAKGDDSFSKAPKPFWQK